MQWFNLNVATLRSPEYIGSDPAARATWLNVSVWCCEQENGGRIFGAKLWKDRQWQQICGVTLDEVNQSFPLLIWDANDLIVWAYPKEKEELVQTKRKAGSIGGRSKSQAKAEASRSNGAKHNPSTSQAEPKQEPNGKERKGKEGNRKITNLAPAEAVAEARPRNELLDALATVGGGKPEEIVPSKWSGIAKALSDIKAVCPDLTIDELQRRARNYRSHYPEAALTPFALASHWAICAGTKRHSSFDEIKIDRS
jgi:hypothetical protein